MRRIKEVTQITSKTTAVEANSYDGIISTVPLSDSADGSFLFTVNNKKVRAVSSILLTTEYPSVNGNSTRAITLTGTSGTANIVVNGVNYLATFTTNLTTSANNFVTTHGATLLALGITVTANTGVLTFVALTEDYPTLSIANVSGDLAGTVGTQSEVASTGNPIANLESYTKESFVIRIQNIGTSALNAVAKIHFKITHE